MPGLNKGVGGKYSKPDFGALVEREAIMGIPHDEIICDFCSARNPKWDYENYPTENEDGGWAACDTCSALIEAGDRKALEDRSVAMAPAQTVKDGLRRRMRATQDVFWNNRKEPRKLI